MASLTDVVITGVADEIPLASEDRLNKILLKKSVKNEGID